MRNLWKITGIYCITHIQSGKKYIGSSTNIKQRFWQHKHLLRKGKHHSVYLQNSWNKYGEESFLFQVLDYCTKEELITCEQQYLDSLNPEYNLTTTATRRGNTFRPHTLEERLHMSRIMRGRVRSAEYCNNISKAKKGKTSPALSTSKLGEKNGMFGKSRTEESKAKNKATRQAHTHCSKGHEYNAENTSVNSNGIRSCITCRRAVARASYYRNKKPNQSVQESK